LVLLHKVLADVADQTHGRLVPVPITAKLAPAPRTTIF